VRGYLKSQMVMFKSDAPRQKPGQIIDETWAVEPHEGVIDLRGTVAIYCNIHATSSAFYTSSRRSNASWRCSRMTVNYAGVAAALSVERLGPYLRRANGSQFDALMLYHRNVVLSESLYATLQLVEVTYRNNFEQYLKTVYGATWFDNATFQGRLKTHDLASIRKAKNKLNDANLALRRKNPTAAIKPITSGAMVAELHFGFWTSLVSNAYSGLFFGPASKTLFPNELLTPSGKTQTDLSKAVNSMLRNVRHLRNRIFHHEPILHDGTLWDAYNAAIHLLEWMNPSVLEWSKRVQLDRFPSAYQVFHGPK
jgi:Abi-like protein